MKPPAPPENQQTSRRRAVALAAALAAGAGAAVLFIGLAKRSGDSAAPELPPDERFIRETVNSFDPTQSTLQRLASVQTALTTLDQLPQTRREAVIIEAMAAGVNRNLEDFRALPEAEKPARAKLLYDDALQTRQYFRRLSANDRRRARELLGDASSGRAQLDRAVNTILNELSADERTMLDPVFGVWKSMLEEP